MDIKITLIANNGVMLECGESKVLLDALHDGKSVGFSSPPDDMLACMMDAQAPFDGVSCLMFTHNHPDHFDAGLVSKYLSANRDTAVLLPQACAEQGDMPSVLAGLGNAAIVPELAGGAQDYSLCGVGVRAYETRHIPGMSDKYKDIRNYCLLINLHGRKFLFPGDANLDIDFYESVAAEHDIDILFTNPLYLNRPRGHRIIKAIGAVHNIITHIPFEEDDGYMLRTVARQELRKLDGELNNAHALMDRMQAVVV